MEEKKCIECGEIKSSKFVRGLCTVCYSKKTRDRYYGVNKIKSLKCIECGREDSNIYIKGLCTACYSKKMRKKHAWKHTDKKYIDCPVCNRRMIKGPKGMCASCYQTERAKNLKKTELCHYCNNNNIIYKLKRCKVCYDLHKDELERVESERRKKYYQENKERLKEVSKKYHDKNKEIYSKRASEWAKNNPERFAELRRKHSSLYYYKNKKNKKE